MMTDRMALTVSPCGFSFSRYGPKIGVGWGGVYFWKSNSPASEFLILGYGKNSHFRGDLKSHLSIKSERVMVDKVP